MNQMDHEDDHMVLVSQLYPGVCQTAPQQGEDKRRRRRKNNTGGEAYNLVGTKKRKLSAEQENILELNFGDEHELESERKYQLASKLGLDPQQVAAWFQNRRARFKNNKLEEEYTKLKNAYESVLVEKHRLESESTTRSLDIEANYGNNGVDSSRKVTLERMFVVTNFILELPSSVLDQLSSVRKSQYALIGMLISLIAMLICIIELIYKARKERVEWRWRRSTRNIVLPWFYYSSPSYDRRFGSFSDIVGLVCAICQCIITIINYSFICRHIDNSIKISVWPIIFAFGLVCSKFMEKEAATSQRY